MPKKINLLIYDVESYYPPEKYFFTENLGDLNIEEWLLENCILFQEIKKFKREKYDKIIVALGSSDNENLMYYHTMATLPLIQTYLNNQIDSYVVLESFLMADIYGIQKNKKGLLTTAEKTAGDSYLEKLKTLSQKNPEKSMSIEDDTRISLIYAHAHRASMFHPEDKIIINFYCKTDPSGSTEWSVLGQSYNFYFHNPDFLPKNVILRFYGDKEKNVIPYEGEIIGAGETDVNYYWSIRYLKPMLKKAAITTGEELQTYSTQCGYSQKDAIYVNSFFSYAEAIQDRYRENNPASEPLSMQACFDQFRVFRKEQIPHLPQSTGLTKVVSYTTAEKLCRDGLIPPEFVLSKKEADAITKKSFALLPPVPGYLARGYQYLSNSSANLYSSAIPCFYSVRKSVTEYLLGNLSVDQEVDFAVTNSVVARIYTINKGDSHYKIGKCLNELDNSPTGRAAYQIANKLTDSNIHLLADTNKTSMPLHRNFVKKFITKNDEIINASIELCKQEFVDGNNEIHIRDKMRNVVFRILSKICFGSYQIPLETNSVMKSCSGVLFSSYSLYPTLSMFSPTVRKVKNEYKNFATAFLRNQQDAVLAIFKSYSEHVNENMVADAIADIIKKENPEWSETELNSYLSGISKKEALDYMNNDFIKTIPSVFILADNIAEALSAFVTACCLSNGQITQDILAEFKSADLDDIRYLEATKLRKNFPYLNQQFRSALTKLRGHAGAIRYTDTDIQIDASDGSREPIRVPANSFIFFNVGKMAENEVVEENGKIQIDGEKSMVFSSKAHTRRCPGETLSELMFKSIALTLSHYSIQSSEKEGYAIILPLSQDTEKTLKMGGLLIFDFFLVSTQNSNTN